MATAPTLERPVPEVGRLPEGPLRSRQPRFFADRLLTTVALLAIAGLLLALAWPMLAGRVYLADDLGDFHLPLRAFYAEQLARGEAFDWCPDLYCGLYLTGEGQVGAYHPLHWLLYRILPLPVAFDLECWISYPLMLVGMCLLLRRWRLRFEAALVGAMIFTFGGFNLLHFVHLNGVATVAHLPWLLLAIDVMVRSPDIRRRRIAFMSIALLTGSQVLLGYPQYVFLSLAVEAASVLWLAGSFSSLSFRYVGQWLAAILLGLLIGGVQLLPTIDALQTSARAQAAANFAAQGSLHPLNVVQLVAPYLFATRVVGQSTHELGLYCGSVTIVLAAYGLFAARRRSTRHLAAGALALSVFALLWSFGEFGPFAWMQANLPVLNKLRFACRTIVVVQFAMAVLAAVGFAAIVRRQRLSSRNGSLGSTRTLWLLPAASVAAAIWGTLAWREFMASCPLVLAGPLLMAVAVALAVLAIRGSRWAIPTMVVLAAVDLGSYGLSHSVIGRTMPLSEFVQDIDAPPGPPTQRAALDLIAGTEAAPMPRGLRLGDQILLRGWKRVDGYAGLEPARRLDYREIAALQAAGTGWISQRAMRQLSIGSAKQVVQDSAYARPWIPINGSRPRAWLVTQAIVATNPAIAISRISLAQQALVDLPITLPSGTAGSATVRTDTPGKIEVATESATEQLLIVCESRHSGWRATVDGRPAEVLAANGDFLGVLVPGGRHEVRFEFCPTSLRWGRFASCFGLGLIVVALSLGRASGRRHPRNSQPDSTPSFHRDEI